MSDRGQGERASGAQANTDRELWREREGDYYSDRVFVTEHGCIGFDVGGFCVVHTPAEWVALEWPPCDECGGRLGHVYWCSGARPKSRLSRVRAFFARRAPVPGLPGEER